jgi:hypothetical protein
MKTLLALIGLQSPPEVGSWAHALACRDLAADLASLCPNSRGEVLVPVFGWQRDMVIGVLAREANRVEDARMDLFERGLR